MSPTDLFLLALGLAFVAVSIWVGALLELHTERMGSLPSPWPALLEVASWAWAAVLPLTGAALAWHLLL